LEARCSRHNLRAVAGKPHTNERFCSGTDVAADAFDYPPTASGNIIVNRDRIRLFWKIAIYYGVCFTLVVTVGLTHPEWMHYLPFGDLDTLQNDLTLSDNGNVVEQLLAPNRPLSLFDDAMNLISARSGRPHHIIAPIRRLYYPSYCSSISRTLSAYDSASSGSSRAERYG